MSFKPGSRIEYRNAIYECDGFCVSEWIDDQLLRQMNTSDATGIIREKLIHSLARKLIEQKVIILGKQHDPQTMRHQITAELNVLRKV